MAKGKLGEADLQGSKCGNTEPCYRQPDPSILWYFAIETETETLNSRFKIIVRKSKGKEANTYELIWAIWEKRRCEGLVQLGYGVRLVFDNEPERAILCSRTQLTALRYECLDALYCRRLISSHFQWRVRHARGLTPLKFRFPRATEITSLQPTNEESEVMWSLKDFRES